MKRKDWNIRLGQSASRGGVRHRDRRVVIPLTISTLVFLAGGLLADIWLGSRLLSIAVYAAAAISGGTLLAYLVVKRLRVRPPPHQ